MRSIIAAITPSRRKDLPGHLPRNPLDRHGGVLQRRLGGLEGHWDGDPFAEQIGDIEHEALSRILMNEAKLGNSGCGGHRNSRPRPRPHSRRG